MNPDEAPVLFELVVGKVIDPAASEHAPVAPGDVLSAVPPGTLGRPRLDDPVDAVGLHAPRELEWALAFIAPDDIDRLVRAFGRKSSVSSRKV